MNTGMWRLLMLCFVMCLATGITVYCLVQSQDKKIGVVDAVRLFDEFNMKKELEARSKLKLQGLGKQMDSITNLLKMAHATRNEEDEKKLGFAYSNLKTNLEKEYKQSNHDINEQVWKRLNAAIEEYGRKRKLHLIIGANGMGTVLYDDETFDLTNDAIQFINKKYEQGI